MPQFGHSPRGSRVGQLALAASIIGTVTLLLVTDAAADRRRQSATPTRVVEETHRARPSLDTSRRSSRQEARSGVENVASRRISPAARELQRALDRAVRSRWMKRGVNGVLVVDARSGETLYSFGADRQLNPASNAKLVSTAAALAALGPDFRYTTRVLGVPPDVDGVIAGDLHLVGSWDPTLRASDLREMAAALAVQGITRVAGDLVIGSGERRDRIAAPVVRVVVTGAARSGQAAAVHIDSAPQLFVVKSTVTTSSKAGKRGRVSVSLTDMGEKILVTVAGRIRPGQRTVARRTVPRGGFFTAHLFHAYLEEAGIEVTGGIRREPDPPSALAELLAHHSPALGEIVAWVNKPSDNWLAERLIWTTGKELFGGSLGTANGVRAMESFLAEIGIDAGTYRLDNGSGLSRTSHLSARQLARVLLHAYRDERISEPYLASLAVAGVDGTLRGRMRGHLARGHVFGKTGTLNGVASLSGFVTTEAGDALAFVIVSNGFPDRRKNSIRAAQDSMVKAMYRYLTERDPALPLVRF